MNTTRHIALSVLTLSIVPTFAAVVVTSVNSPGAGAPLETVYAADVSTSDLLQGIVGVDSGAAWLQPSARLNNGAHGPSFDDDNSGSLAEIAWANPGSAVTFNLGTGANGLGFDISSIQTIAAWQSAGFGNQGYTIEIQPVGGSFSVLETVVYNPFTDAAGATRVTLTDDGGGPGGNLATGIEAIRFTHNSVPGSTDGRVTYRELDVFGTDTIPEPSSLALLGLCAVGFLRRRRS